MFRRINEDIDAVMERDPAVKSRLEVYFLYPSFKAIRAYRRAHWWFKRGHFFIARWISQNALRRTGIEIHPGAKIGKKLFIDHGSGVVIGETTEIGDNCTLYQGVTLGGTGKDVGKRHPTLGNNVMVGSGAKVLGPFKVGDNSKIAANAVVLNEVPPNSTAVGIPASVVVRDGIKVEKVEIDLDQIHIPDPIKEQIDELKSELKRLSKIIEEKDT
ncbi:MAG: serine O-acetyltransferase [Oscillospiraceae bacterium]|nr:serine O-acetyltransferase [Oscillospiraceae bacterium]